MSELKVPNGWKLGRINEAIKIIDYRERTQPCVSSCIPYI